MKKRWPLLVMGVIGVVLSTRETFANRADPPGAAHVLQIGCHSSIILTLLGSERNSFVSAMDLSTGSPMPVFCVHSGAMCL